MKPRPVANPPNPWASTEVDYLGEAPIAKPAVYEDHTRQIIAKNDSPDVGFSFSVNPYRGCGHACAYCFARPSHEYLGFRAGSDFDTQIVVKLKAAELLREAFEKPTWQGEVLVFSGVTDCYQPLEASLRLTRSCLEVCVEYKNPVGIITKAPLVERDLDLFQELTRVASARVNVSIPLWNTEHARALEPGVATPRRRMQIVEKLSRAGVPVNVMVAPIIPGLGEEQLTELLRAAKDAGARSANYVLLRLPGSVKEVFETRLREAMPLRAEKVLHRVRETRGGQLYDARFGIRGRGEGLYAKTFEQMFDAMVKRYGLEGETPLEPARTFTRPLKAGHQLAFF